MSIFSPIPTVDLMFDDYDGDISKMSLSNLNNGNHTPNEKLRSTPAFEEETPLPIDDNSFMDICLQNVLESVSSLPCPPSESPSEESLIKGSSVDVPVKNSNNVSVTSNSPQGSSESELNSGGRNFIDLTADSEVVVDSSGQRRRKSLGIDQHPVITSPDLVPPTVSDDCSSLQTSVLRARLQPKNQPGSYNSSTNQSDSRIRATEHQPSYQPASVSRTNQRPSINKPPPPYRSHNQPNQSYQLNSQAVTATRRSSYNGASGVNSQANINEQTPPYKSPTYQPHSSLQRNCQPPSVTGQSPYQSPPYQSPSYQSPPYQSSVVSPGNKSLPNLNNPSGSYVIPNNRNTQLSHPTSTVTQRSPNQSFERSTEPSPHHSQPSTRSSNRERGRPRGRKSSTNDRQHPPITTNQNYPVNNSTSLSVPPNQSTQHGEPSIATQQSPYHQAPPSETNFLPNNVMRKTYNSNQGNYQSSSLPQEAFQHHPISQTNPLSSILALMKSSCVNRPPHLSSNATQFHQQPSLQGANRLPVQNSSLTSTANQQSYQQPCGPGTHQQPPVVNSYLPQPVPPTFEQPTAPATYQQPSLLSAYVQQQPLSIPVAYQQQQSSVTVAYQQQHPSLPSTRPQPVINNNQPPFNSTNFIRRTQPNQSPFCQNDSSLSNHISSSVPFSQMSQNNSRHLPNQSLAVNSRSAPSIQQVNSNSCSSSQVYTVRHHNQMQVSVSNQETPQQVSQTPNTKLSSYSQKSYQSNPSFPSPEQVMVCKKALKNSVIEQLDDLTCINKLLDLLEKKVLTGKTNVSSSRNESEQNAQSFETQKHSPTHDSLSQPKIPQPVPQIKITILPQNSQSLCQNQYPAVDTQTITKPFNNQTAVICLTVSEQHSAESNLAVKESVKTSSIVPSSVGVKTSLTSSTSDITPQLKSASESKKNSSQLSSVKQTRNPVTKDRDHAKTIVGSQSKKPASPQSDRSITDRKTSSKVRYNPKDIAEKPSVIKHNSGKPIPGERSKQLEHSKGALLNKSDAKNQHVKQKPSCNSEPVKEKQKHLLSKTLVIPHPVSDNDKKIIAKEVLTPKPKKSNSPVKLKPKIVDKVNEEELPLAPSEKDSTSLTGVLKTGNTSKTSDQVVTAVECTDEPERTCNSPNKASSPKRSKTPKSLPIILSEAEPEMKSMQSLEMPTETIDLTGNSKTDLIKNVRSIFDEKPTSPPNEKENSPKVSEKNALSVNSTVEKTVVSVKLNVFQNGPDGVLKESESNILKMSLDFDGSESTINSLKDILGPEEEEDDVKNDDKKPTPTSHDIPKVKKHSLNEIQSAPFKKIKKALAMRNSASSFDLREKKLKLICKRFKNSNKTFPNKTHSIRKSEVSVGKEHIKSSVKKRTVIASDSEEEWTYSTPTKVRKFSEEISEKGRVSERRTSNKDEKSKNHTQDSESHCRAEGNADDKPTVDERKPSNPSESNMKCETIEPTSNQPPKEECKIDSTERVFKRRVVPQYIKAARNKEGKMTPNWTNFSFNVKKKSTEMSVLSDKEIKHSEPPVLSEGIGGEQTISLTSLLSEDIHKEKEISQTPVVPEVVSAKEMSPISVEVIDDEKKVPQTTVVSEVIHSEKEISQTSVESKVTHSKKEVSPAPVIPQVIHGEKKDSQTPVESEVIDDEKKVPQTTVVSEVIHSEKEISQTPVESEVIHSKKEVSQGPVVPQVIHEEKKVSQTPVEPEVIDSESSDPPVLSHAIKSSSVMSETVGSDEKSCNLQVLSQVIVSGKKIPEAPVLSETISGDKKLTEREVLSKMIDSGKKGSETPAVSNMMDIEESNVTPVKSEMIHSDKKRSDSQVISEAGAKKKGSKTEVLSDVINKQAEPSSKPKNLPNKVAESGSKIERRNSNENDSSRRLSNPQKRRLSMPCSLDLSRGITIKVPVRDDGGKVTKSVDKLETGGKEKSSKDVGLSERKKVKADELKEVKEGKMTDRPSYHTSSKTPVKKREEKVRNRISEAKLIQLARVSRCTVTLKPLQKVRSSSTFKSSKRESLSRKEKHAKKLSSKKKIKIEKLVSDKSKFLFRISLQPKSPPKAKGTLPRFLKEIDLFEDVLDFPNVKNSKMVKKKERKSVDKADKKMNVETTQIKKASRMTSLMEDLFGDSQFGIASACAIPKPSQPIDKPVVTEKRPAASDIPACNIPSDDEDCLDLLINEVNQHLYDNEKEKYHSIRRNNLKRIDEQLEERTSSSEHSTPPNENPTENHTEVQTNGSSRSQPFPAELDSLFDEVLST